MIFSTLWVVLFQIILPIFSTQNQQQQAPAPAPPSVTNETNSDLGYKVSLIEAAYKDGAVCLDGSTPHFYFSANSQSNKYYIHFQGILPSYSHCFVFIFIFFLSFFCEYAKCLLHVIANRRTKKNGKKNKNSLTKQKKTKPNKTKVEGGVHQQQVIDHQVMDLTHVIKEV